MKKLLMIAFLTIGMILQGVGSAKALLLPQMSIQDMVIQANTVVSGKCLSLHFHPDPNGKTLYAVIQFKVDEYLKNDLGEEEITLMHVAREEGVDGRRQPGTVSFHVDEEALLFLTEEDNAGFRHVMGLPQGKFAVQEKQNGERTLIRDLTGVRFFDRATGEISKGAGPYEEKDLETFRKEVIRTVSRIKASKQEFILVKPNRSP